MRIDILTIFPGMFSSYFNESILKRAQKNKKIKIVIHDIRKFGRGKNRQVDDTPYGGGAGMVMCVDPIYQTLKKIKKMPRRKIILLSAKGKTWTQPLAKKYSKLNQLILICPRYEGVDERIKHLIDEEISLGDFVITGGELGAMIIVDSVARLLKGVLGKTESLKEESHTKKGYLEYPHYTKPSVLKLGKKTYAVPEVLLSGDHKKIMEWRQQNSKTKK